MVSTQPAADPLESVIREYQENPWVRKLSRDYRERKLNIEKTANSEQTLRMISCLRERAISHDFLKAAEGKTKKFLMKKISDLEAEKMRLDLNVKGLNSCLDLIKRREETCQVTIQRLSAELRQCRENAREYRALEKALYMEKQARLLLDENYKSLVASKGLSLHTLETISENYEKALLSTSLESAENLDDGKEPKATHKKGDETVGSETEHENLDEIDLDELAKFPKMLLNDLKTKRCKSVEYS